MWGFNARILFRDLQFIFAIVFDSGVGNVEILTVDHPQHRRGAARFLFPQGRVAARAGFARREVEEAHAIARFRHLDDRAPAGDPDVVRVRRNSQDINFQIPVFLPVPTII